MPYPDFLCIGAQKSGTTWLYHQLGLHPEIWLPPVKELHYFDWRKKSRLIQVFFSNTQKGRFVRSISTLFLATKSAGWARHFLFNKRSYENYKNLFQPSRSQISGDITPAYARLNGDVIQEIYSCMPDLKLIYLLRNPVERAWSQMNMYRRRSDVRSHIPYSKIFEIKERALIRNSCYTKNLDRWTKHYTSSQLFIGFYEQIKEDPLLLISNLLEFLNVDPVYRSQELEHSVKVPRNKGHHGDMPLEIELLLSGLFLDELKLLDQRFKNKHTEQWLKRANEVLEGH